MGLRKRRRFLKLKTRENYVLTYVHVLTVKNMGGLIVDKFVLKIYIYPEESDLRTDVKRNRKEKSRNIQNVKRHWYCSSRTK